MAYFCLRQMLNLTDTRVVGVSEDGPNKLNTWSP